MLKDERFDKYLLEHTIFSRYCDIWTHQEQIRIYYDDMPPFVPKLGVQTDSSAVIIKHERHSF